MVPEIWSATEFLVILDYFLPFYLHNNPENQIFQKKKKIVGGIIILHVYDKWESYDGWFLGYGAQQTEFVNFGPFFALLPP